MNKGDKTSNGWATIRVDSDAESGYRGVLYEGKYDGKTEYIYATAGTDDAGDWGNNLRQLSGKSEQYSMSIGIARSLAMINIKAFLLLDIHWEVDLLVQMLYLWKEKLLHSMLQDYLMPLKRIIIRMAI